MNWLAVPDSAMDVLELDNAGKSPLNAAIEMGQLDVINWFLTHPVD